MVIITRSNKCKSYESGVSFHAIVAINGGVGTVSFGVNRKRVIIPSLTLNTGISISMFGAYLCK